MAKNVKRHDFLDLKKGKKVKTWQ